MIRNFASRELDAAQTFAAAALACLCLLGAIAPAASADIATEIAERCGQGKSLAGFTVKQYQEALKHLPTEVLEYSACAEEIQKAELAAASHKAGGGGTGGSTGAGSSGEGPSAPPVEPTPAQQQILEQTRRNGVPAVHLGGGAQGGSVSPGVVHPDLASAASDLPAPVLAVIAAVVGGILVLAAQEINRRVQRSRHG
jgi:hypothetical protein